MTKALRIMPWSFLALAVPLWGDHLPERLIAVGKPETALATIPIQEPYRTLQSIEKEWGGGKVVKESDDGAACDRLLSWTRGGVTVTIRLENGVRKEAFA